MTDHIPVQLTGLLWIVYYLPKTFFPVSLGRDRVGLWWAVRRAAEERHGLVLVQIRPRTDHNPNRKPKPPPNSNNPNRYN